MILWLENLLTKGPYHKDFFNMLSEPNLSQIFAFGILQFIWNFHQIGPLVWFGLVLAMSIRIRPAIYVSCPLPMQFLFIKKLQVMDLQWGRVQMADYTKGDCKLWTSLEFWLMRCHQNSVSLIRTLNRSITCNLLMKKYWCYYPHCSRYLEAPVWGTFHLTFCNFVSTTGGNNL